MKKIILARHAGFCFGVRRAIEIAEKELTQKKHNVFCYGEIIHNAIAVKDLKSRGLKIVKDLKEVPRGGYLIIRSHGASPEVFAEALKKNVHIIDATCPFVRKAQEIAKDFHEKGFQAVIVGDKKHPEIVSINANTKNTAIVINSEKEVLRMKNFSKIGLLSQTTGKFGLLKEVAVALLGKTKNLSVSNTICLDSFSKKEEIKTISKNIDILFVIGDRHSNNTKKLAEIGAATGVKTYQIESADDIKTEWLKDKEKIGITAGASTPDVLIEQVKERITLI